MMRLSVAYLLTFPLAALAKPTPFPTLPSLYYFEACPETESDNNFPAWNNYTNAVRDLCDNWVPKAAPAYITLIQKGLVQKIFPSANRDGKSVRGLKFAIASPDANWKAQRITKDTCVKGFTDMLVDMEDGDNRKVENICYIGSKDGKTADNLRVKGVLKHNVREENHATAIFTVAVTDAIQASDVEDPRATSTPPLPN
ncbi:hypothetical protein BCR34DRAFT_596956 [Clohesyomyces aquaticus]|uniref:Uncharacterized protein n=1 Tax=Clohesyomyces aquaticus TaxID=1231657 RepID=A0A1Y2A5A2_9PLEO|nr:hypothetical protein BCR34DRAFT_596956 [Clohesyomyces aquaticus]